MVDWSELPNDIIHKVASYLSVVEDLLAFSAVCSSWRSVYLANQWHPGTQVPVLMFSDNENSRIRSFLSLYSCKVSNSELSESSGRRCWGSSSGWVVTIGNDFKIQLLNPFTRVTIDLPPKSSLQIFFGDFLKWFEIIERAFVFRKPCTSNANEDLVVMLIYGNLRQLAFCKPGYSSWKCLKNRHIDEFVVDVACVKDQIFALTFMGSLVIVDLDSQSVINICGLPPSPPRHISLSVGIGGWDHLSLVESSGDLWMVDHIQSWKQWRSRLKSTEFVVHSLDWEKREWIRLSNLGSRTLFVSDKSCIVASAPHYSNCECNSVYFVASKREKGWPNRITHVNVGVYSLSSGVSRPLCISPDIQKRFYFPLWVTPTLH